MRLSGMTAIGSAEKRNEMDRIRESIRVIWRGRFRSLLTISGVAIGVFSVMCITVIGEIGKKGIRAELNSMGIGGLHIAVAEEQIGSTAFGKEELDLVKKSGYVEEATPFLTKTANIRVHGVPSQAILWGVDANASRIVSMELLHGRLITASDVQDRKRVCVVDAHFAESHYHRENIVGKRVEVWCDGRFLEFTVIGVVKTGGNLLQSMVGGIVPNFLYAPYLTLLQGSSGERFSQMVVKLADGAEESRAAEALSRGLDAQLGTEDGIKVDDLNGQREQLDGILDIVVSVLSVIGGISLLVAGLSIMTVMLMTVQQRTREIGIKKSIGAPCRVILAEFLTEALLISLIGSMIGAVGGIAFGGIAGALLGMGWIVDWKKLFLCMGFCLLAGGIFGGYPAMQAAKMKPVDALRAE